MNQIDLSSVSPKTIYPLSTAQFGETAHGRAVSLTNYYMELNGKPFYGIGGEMQYSRLWEETWKDELLKMKAGGVNIVSTYVFWNHHEEVEGVFDFSGRKNLRRFLELCAECGLFAIVRVGPFTASAATVGSRIGCTENPLRSGVQTRGS